MYLHLHSLDVAAVRVEPQSYNTTDQCIILIVQQVQMFGLQMHHLHTIKGRTTAVIQMADTGVSVVFWTISAVFIPNMDSAVCHQNKYRHFQCLIVINCKILRVIINSLFYLDNALKG